MSLQIRKAVSEDYESLLPLYDQVDSIHREALPEIFTKPVGEPRAATYFEDLLQQPGVGFFVAEEQGELVGFVHAVLVDAPPMAVFNPRRYVVVDGVVVKKDYQGKGAGRKLMETIHEWARDLDAGSIELNVYEFNQDSISFYQRLGYKPLSRKMHKPLRNQDADGIG